MAVGHSAGGHLALWAAARPGPARRSARRRAAACGWAGSSPWPPSRTSRRRRGPGLGGAAGPRLLGGGPDEVPERYVLASPAARLPLGVPTLLVHGDADEAVPVA